MELFLPHLKVTYSQVATRLGDVHQFFKNFPVPRSLLGPPPTRLLNFKKKNSYQDVLPIDLLYF